MSYIEVELDFSQIDASRRLFLTSSGSLVFEQRQTANLESNTSSVGSGPIHSSRRCFRNVTLSTTSAA